MDILILSTPDWRGGVTPQWSHLSNLKLRTPEQLPEISAESLTLVWDFGEAAERARELFMGKAKSSTCHVPPAFTGSGWNMHKASEVCVDDFQANRAPDHAYRTTPLNGLWAHMKGGFYHDGRFATLADVVDHYESCFSLALTAQEKEEVVEYLKSLPQSR